MPHVANGLETLFQTIVHLVVVEHAHQGVVRRPVEPDLGHFRSVTFQNVIRHVRTEVGVVVKAASGG